MADTTAPHPSLLDHPETRETDDEIVAIERHLQATLPEEG